MTFRLRELGLACASLAMSSCGGGSTEASTAAVAVVSTGTSTVSSSTAPIPAATPTPAPTATAERFDLAYYLKTYPDVAAAYGQNAKEHYDKHGRWEGRLPYEGAMPWRPDANTPPSTFAYAPGCEITLGDVWAPEGSTQVRVQFQLTRFGGSIPCERSYAIAGGVSNWSGTTKGLPGINLGEQAQNMVVSEVTTLPSQDSRGELIVNVPPWRKTGGFHMWLSSAEYNPPVKTEFDILVGGDRPKDARYYPDPLVLSAPTAYPTDLGKATYDTDFLGDLASEGWTFWDMGGLNGMSGAFTTPTTKTASGKLTDNYPIVTDGSGQRVRALVLRDHRNDLVGGKALFSAPMISRLLGTGGYGYRLTLQTLPKPMKGTDAALWGVRHAGGWPPEFDTHEGFAGDPRVYQTVHMPDGTTTSSTPRVDIVGKHEWLEEFGRQTYRLWIDKKLVVERPNYLAGEILDTTFSIEGPGGAGGLADFSQPYDGLSMLLYRQTWWQR